MIDEEGRGTMQKKNEASLGCFKIKTSKHNPQESRKAIDGFSTLTDESIVHAGNIVEIDNSLNRDVFASPNQGYPRILYNQAMSTLPNFHIDIHLPQCLLYPPGVGVPHLNYVPHKSFSQAYSQEVQYQEFQYFVVIDFEATCDKEKNPHPQEIIEFPSVLVNSATRQLEASFQTYVRPAYHQHLTDFCKELTGIQQIQVDRGVPLSEALLMHDKWLEDKGIKYKNFAVVTWSNWDCGVMLESECKFKKIRKPPYFNRWINLKVPFQEVYGGNRRTLKDAVQLAGLTWEGRAHCGLDDARNTARLLAVLMLQGFRFSITNSMSWQSATDLPQKPEALLPPLYLPQIIGDPAALFPKQFVDPTIQIPKLLGEPSGERGIYCHCGVMSSKCMVRKPGPTQGRCFFGCGKWTAARRAVCNYFVWASP